MATWQEVKEYLAENFNRDFGIQAISGADSYAASVETSSGTEVVLVFNNDPLIQMVSLIGNTNSINLDKLLANLNIFGIKSVNNMYALQHVGFLDTLDAVELVGPIKLMAGECAELKKKASL